MLGIDQFQTFSMNISEHSTEGVNAARDSYVMHIFPFSLYSIMARLTYAFAKITRTESKIIIVNELVDLHRDENISEEFLLHINPKGQVRFNFLPYTR